MEAVILSISDFPQLLEILSRNGYLIFGPTVSQKAIVYDEVRSIQDLPVGWTDEQDAGAYRIKKGKEPEVFGYTSGPHSWKKFLHLPNLLLWRSKKKGSSLEIESPSEYLPKMAFLGVRACEIQAIVIQDRVFLQGPFRDPDYEVRRNNTLIIAVNCTKAGGTCFCVSMNAGPKVESGFDLALTEITSPEHRFLVEMGSERGAKLLQELTVKKATEADFEAARNLMERARTRMGRRMDTDGIRELLYRNYDNHRWDQVASRCLSCTNCTMVCPTCFCTTVDDVTSLNGDTAERWRRWDSCFTLDFSYIHGGTVRSSVKSRYRRWLTHKLATWMEQFGSSGCVGCGRCVTWCPVGIDLTEEILAIRQSENPASGQGETA